MRGRSSAAELVENAAALKVAMSFTPSRAVPRFGDDIVPLIGARRRDRLAESIGALALTLDREDLAALENLASSVSGARYAKAQMAHLDSEGR
ncbi:MAG: hypothetical protein WC689_00995 [Methylocystis sp.]|jgi:aryl-alcohol dehydrogenase-like predicted oxidoreductase